MHRSMNWGMLLFLCACLGYSSPSWALPKRLILAVDGVSYNDVVALQGQGKFRDFFPVSRNISTYPSLSDIAWADIFSTYRPLGYQRFHYSLQANRIIGGSLSDLGNPIEYEKRMHLAFESKIHHGASYAFPLRMGTREIHKIVRDLLKSKESGTFYAYMLSTDTLQHTDGDIRKLLERISEALEKLQSDYRRLSGGRNLEISIVSDHGNNKKNTGIRVPLREHLNSKGWSVVDSIQKETDVVFTAAGILSAISIFARPSQLESISAEILKIEGVDLITRIIPDSTLTILVQNAAGEAALIRKKPNTHFYTYQPLQGDPLQYLDLASTLREEGKMDEDGFASADDWLTVSQDHFYPAALERIYRGHFLITANTAPLIVSLKDGYENANETIKALSNIKPRGGTHGALSQASSSGILLSNYKETQAITTNRVEAFLDFSDLPNYRMHSKGVELLNSAISGVDLTTGKPILDTDPLGPQHTLFFNIWDPMAAEMKKLGIETRYEVIIKKDSFLFFNSSISNGRKLFEAKNLPRTPDWTEYRIPVLSVIQKLESATDYLIYVQAIRGVPGNPESNKRTEIAKYSFSTDIDGHALAY